MSSTNQEILKLLQYEHLQDRVSFVYDGWLGFSIIPTSNPKKRMAVKLIHDVNTGKSLDYENGFNPIVHVAYAVSADKLFPKIGQMDLDI
jgi:hypothetical protein